MSNVLAILWTLELQCHPALKINKNDEPFVQLIRRYTVASFAEMASPFCTSASNLSWNLALSPALGKLLIPPETAVYTRTRTVSGEQQWVSREAIFCAVIRTV